MLPMGTSVPSGIILFQLRLAERIGGAYLESARVLWENCFYLVSWDSCLMAKARLLKRGKPETSIIVTISK